MRLPVVYDDLTWQEKKAVREEYVKEQNGLCWYCGFPLSGGPPANVARKPVDRRRFPPGFFDWPVHLHHDKVSGLTIGAVHNYCNAVSFLYEEVKMPTITQQSRIAKPITKPSFNGSAWDMIDYLRVLLYGESGTGKTTTWATFPGPIKAAICSGGKRPGELRSINTTEYRKKIDPRVINSTDEFKVWLKSLAGCQTAVLDHASGFADIVLREILGLDHVPEQKGWGLATQQQYGQQSLQLKEYFRDLLNSPCNVVIVAQERVFKGADEGMSDIIKPTVGAALTPSVAGWLNPACDYVVQTFKRPKMVVTQRKVGNQVVKTEERGKGVEYCLRTEPHDVYMTKFRVPRGKVLPDLIVDPTYEKILKVIQG